ncbi:MAG: HAMP domain-containing histidine kinase [Bacteroidia bacterium]|nr:HAMP domain-containing histidine kinase [Bacteroidia bacterium]
MRWLKDKSSNTWIYIAVMVYLILAFGWWAYLLIESSNREFSQQVMQLASELSLGPNETSLLEGQEYQDFYSAYKRKITMVITEGFVFVLTLSFGLYLLVRSYRSEIAYRTQQKNFLLSITHELKSPLASTRLALETIQKRKLEEEQQAELLKSALHENQRLSTLVNDILLSTRMEEAYEPVLERTNIENIFERLVTAMKYKYPNIRWNIQSEFNEKHVIVDQSGLTSIMVNLMENAAKYSNKKGDVRIIYKEYNNNLVIKIADFGIGIPDEEKKMIFEKFYRVGNEEVRKSKGTGLGLYLVKKLIDNYGGKIAVHDNRPKGTIFDITLPINLPET